MYGTKKINIYFLIERQIEPDIHTYTQMYSLFTEYTIISLFVLMRLHLE